MRVKGKSRNSWLKWMERVLAIGVDHGVGVAMCAEHAVFKIERVD